MTKQTESSKIKDPYPINYNFDNSIQFRDDKRFFPFSCFDVFVKITSLKDKLYDKNVCATDLQSFPIKIFKETELRNHELSKWVYNIIETWVTDVEVRIHQNKKTRLFDGFLKACESLVLEYIPPQQPGGEKDVIKLLIERTEINNFLSVPAPDILHKNAFWHDEKDKPIDSHREIIIAHGFKVKAAIETDKTALQWKNERGEKARQQYYTTLKQSENYKEPTIRELSKVIELLKDFPTAQKMAINKHAELESL